MERYLLTDRLGEEKPTQWSVTIHKMRQKELFLRLSIIFSVISIQEMMTPSSWSGDHIWRFTTREFLIC